MASRKKRCQSIFRPRHPGMYKIRTVSLPFWWHCWWLAEMPWLSSRPYVLIRFGFTQLPPPPSPSGPWKLRVHDDEYTLSQKNTKRWGPKKGCAKASSVRRYSKIARNSSSVGRYLPICACYRFKQRWASLSLCFPILDRCVSDFSIDATSTPPHHARL